MVCTYLPSLGSTAGERNYHFWRALAHRHTVSLLSLVDSARVEAHDVRPQLEDLAYSVQLIPFKIPHFKRYKQLLSIARGRSYLLNLFTLKEVQSALDKMLARDHYDAVLFESALVAGYRLPAGVKVIIDQHNIEHELLRLTYEQEKTWLRMRKAVVSTSVGYQGLAVESGKHLIVADGPESFAEAVVALLSNSEMRTTYGTAGRSLVEAEYSWEKCGDRLLHILAQREFVC